MLTKQQTQIIKNSTFKELVLNTPEIIYVIKKNKIEPYWTKFIRSKLKNKEWTNSVITNCAKTCRNRMEFSKYFSFAYTLAIKRNILNKIMKDKPKAEQNYRVYTLDIVLQMCKEKNIINFYDFRKKLPGPYQQSYQQGFVPSIKDYFKTTLAVIYRDNITIADELYDYYPSLVSPNRSLNEFFIHFPNQKILIKTIIEKRLIEEVPPMEILKVEFMQTSFQDLKKKYLGMALKKIKFTDFVPRVPKKVKTKSSKRHSNKQFEKQGIRYTNESIIEEAKKYNCRKEFGEKDKGRYEAAIRRKLLEEACAHMEKPYESLGEQLVRKAFNYHFNTVFYKLKPDWLVNPKTGKRLELDGFNDELKIAFEVNGGHHFLEIFNKKLPDIKNKDAYKVQVCQEKGIQLYVFIYDRSLYDLSRVLHKLFQIPKDWLANVVYDLKEKLSTEEIIHYRELLKVNSKNPNLTEIDYQSFANYINELRKQNLTTIKIQQVLGVTKHHLSHRINRMKDFNIKIIQR